MYEREFTYLPQASFEHTVQQFGGIVAGRCLVALVFFGGRPGLA